MTQHLIVSLVALFATHASLLAQELSVNGFRNPSVGVEYRHDIVSVHAGYYPTIISEDSDGNNETTSFVRAGLTYWFMPLGDDFIASSFYGSLSYLRGVDDHDATRNAAIGELGFRWLVWKGINLRLGVAALYAPGERIRINPTPGISYSFDLR